MDLDQFELLSSGSGAKFGEVYRAIAATNDNKKVAVKYVPIAPNHEFFERQHKMSFAYESMPHVVKQEAYSMLALEQTKIAQQLSLHVPRLLWHGMREYHLKHKTQWLNRHLNHYTIPTPRRGVYALVMELCDGSLKSLRRQQDDWLSDEAWASMIVQGCMCLLMMHERELRWAHNDTHWGNFLYKRLAQPQNIRYVFVEHDSNDNNNNNTKTRQYEWVMRNVDRVWKLFDFGKCELVRAGTRQREAYVKEQWEDVQQLLQLSILKSSVKCAQQCSMSKRERNDIFCAVQDAYEQVADPKRKKIYVPSWLVLRYLLTHANRFDESYNGAYDDTTNIDQTFTVDIWPIEDLQN